MPVSFPHGDPTVGFARSDKLRLAQEILTTYVRVRWLLAKRRLPQVVTTLREAPHRDVDGEAELAAGGGWRYALPVVKTLRLLPTDARCLVRSLVLLAVLSRRGAATMLVIGVRPEPRFKAHAWIEYRGTPLLEPGDGEYERLLEL